jgi:poly(hydroxyalkanoate) depolymerase family esterase
MFWRAFALVRTSALPPRCRLLAAVGALPVLVLAIGCASGAARDSAPAAPSGVSSGGVVAEGVMELHDESRAYRVFVPVSHADGGAMPLLVLLHGCTQSPSDVALGTQMDIVAGELGVMVVYPEQPDRYHIQRCWRWYEPAHQQRGQGEPAVLAAIAREVAERYGADRQRIYVAGISAGGLMALATALSYPDVFAAVGVHSAGAYGVADNVPRALALMRDGAPNVAAAADAAMRTMGERARLIPMIVLHGDSDAVVHPRNADDLVAQWRGVAARTQTDLAGAEEQPIEEGGRLARRLRYSNAAGMVMIERWMIGGLGHAWSGGSTSGSYADSAGPDASRAVVRFLLAHRLP